MAQSFGSDAKPWTLDSFLEEAPAPNLPKIEDNLRDFITHNSNRPIVVVTSGGCIVPLERQCVRFIDNFSRGNRGAFSVEAFLASGYAVIFLTRTGSAQPFVVDFQERLGISSLVDVFELNKDGTVHVAVERHKELASAVEKAAKVLEEGIFLQIQFTTIFEYMKYLQAISNALAPLGSSVLFYLAAAVSDFFVPWSEVVEHKIQSSGGALHLALQPVPKALGTLRSVWAPEAMIVSFKLETDQALLLKKAAKAIRDYSVDMVVANELHSRKDVVYLVSAKADDDSTIVDVEGAHVRKVQRPEDDPVIENVLVAHVVEAHKRHMEKAPKQKE